MLIEFKGYFVYHFVSFYVLVKFNVKIMVVILQLSQILVMKNHKKKKKKKLVCFLVCNVYEQEDHRGATKKLVCNLGCSPPEQAI
jgi:hypothetical protein